MKRIDAIAKGKSNQMSSSIERKGARIMRNVEQAVACAEDKLDYLSDKAESLIDSLGGVAEADQTSSCQNTINRYIDTIKEYNDWKETLEILHELRSKLDEEVELADGEE